MKVNYKHVPHPHTLRRRHLEPPRTEDGATGVGDRIGLAITAKVGTMACAAFFLALSLVSLPAALATGSVIIIVGWVAQTFLQLVLLPVIIVGQNLQSRAADKRSELTYEDAEAVLHHCIELEMHLKAQDGVFEHVVDRLEHIVTHFQEKTA